MITRGIVAVAAGLGLAACAGVRLRPEPAPNDRGRLEAEIASLRADVDSLRCENDSLRLRFATLDSLLSASETRLRVVSLELQRLKDIDLRPRPARPR